MEATGFKGILILLAAAVACVALFRLLRPAAVFAAPNLLRRRGCGRGMF